MLLLQSFPFLRGTHPSPQLLKSEICESSLSVSFSSFSASLQLLRVVDSTYKCILKTSTFLHVHCSHNRASSDPSTRLSAAFLQSTHYMAAKVNFINVELIASLSCLKFFNDFLLLLGSSSKDPEGPVI